MSTSGSRSKAAQGSAASSRAAESCCAARVSVAPVDAAPSELVQHDKATFGSRKWVAVLGLPCASWTPECGRRVIGVAGTHWARSTVRGQCRGEGDECQV
jgi:hypothetical protein